MAIIAELTINWLKTVGKAGHMYKYVVLPTTCTFDGNYIVPTNSLYS